MASERVNELQASIFPSLKRRGGCGINKKARSLRSAADGVVSSAKLFRPKDFADLTTRLRELRLLRDIFLIAHPPSFSRRGIMPDSNSHVLSPGFQSVATSSRAAAAEWCKATLRRRSQIALETSTLSSDPHFYPQ